VVVLINQGSFVISGGGSQDGRGNSLRRLHIVSGTKISGNISIELKKIYDDIAKGKTEPRISDPFPVSRDIQYQLRFFSLNHMRTYCELHIDIAHDYLKTLKTKGTTSVTVRIPEIKVLVTMSISSRLIKNPNIITKKSCKVSARSEEIINIEDYLKHRQNYIRVTYFPDVIKLEDLFQFRTLDQGKLNINVEIDVLS